MSRSLSAGRRSIGSRQGTGFDQRGAHWAQRSELRALSVNGLEPGRLVLGTLARSRGKPSQSLLAAEPAQSVAVIGPTQSGKTTSLAVPAILGWEGPVVAASVKTDLVHDTLAWRRRCGRVWCFDPARTTGLPASQWSPLPAAQTWSGARRVAADLTEVTKSAGTTADGEFWYATAAKLLAPLLFAAAHGGLQMSDVVRWVDTQEVAEVAAILDSAGVPEALQAARATWQRDDRQRSSVYTTAETVLEPFANPEAPSGDTPAHRPQDGPVWDGPRRGHPPGAAETPPYGTPAVGAGSPGGWGDPDPGDIDPEMLLHGSHTLYLCAPAHDQRRLRGLFTAVVKQVLEVAFALGPPRRSPHAATAVGTGRGGQHRPAGGAGRAGGHLCRPRGAVGHRLAGPGPGHGPLRGAVRHRHQQPPGEDLSIGHGRLWDAGPCQPSRR